MFQTFKPTAYTAPVDGMTNSTANSVTQNNTTDITNPIRDESQTTTTTTTTNNIPSQYSPEEEETMNVWLEKVENISKNDPGWMDMSNESLAATVFATQSLVQALTQDSLLLSSFRQNQQQQAQNVAPTQDINLTYNDIADCISIKEQYSFLSDMIPRTKPLKELVRENKIRYTTFVSNDQTQEIDINNDDTEEE